MAFEGIRSNGRVDSGQGMPSGSGMKGSCPFSSAASGGVVPAVDGAGARLVAPSGHGGTQVFPASEANLGSGSSLLTINTEGRIILADLACCALFGYSLNELIGRPLKDLIPRPYREQHDMYVQKYVRTGVKTVIGLSRVVEALRRDGAVIPIRLSVAEVHSSDGEVLFMGTIDRVEETGAIATCAADGRILSCNQRFEYVFGWTISELATMRIHDLVDDPCLYVQSEEERGLNVSGVLNSAHVIQVRSRSNEVFPASLRVTTASLQNISMYRFHFTKLDNTVEVVMTLNSSGYVLSCNRFHLALLFGYTDDDLGGGDVHINRLLPTFFESAVQSNPSAWRTIRSKDERFSHQQKLEKEEGMGLDMEMEQKNIDGGDRKVKRNENEKAKEKFEEEGFSSSMKKQKHQSDSSVSNSSSSSSNTTLSNSTSTVPSKPCLKSDSNSNSNSTVTSTPSQSISLRHNHPSSSGTEHPPIHSIPLDSMEHDIDQWVPQGIESLLAVHRDGSTFSLRFSVFRFSQPNGGDFLYSVRVFPAPRPLLAAPLEAPAPGSFPKLANYRVLEVIGRGSFGTVLSAMELATNATVAIKVLKKVSLDPSEMARLRREVEIMRGLRHPNVVRLRDVIEDNDKLVVIMEYAAGGELITYITEAGCLPEDEAHRLFTQLVSAVHYIHSRRIVHRDIKHKNILLDSNLNIKLIDFGLSNFINQMPQRATFCGTPAYAAPEMILAQKYNGPEVDIWSMGVVLFSMLFGRFPFATVDAIVRADYTFDTGVCSVAVCDLMTRIFVRDRDARISLPRIVAHPWFVHGPRANLAESTSASSTPPPSSTAIPRFLAEMNVADL